MEWHSEWEKCVCPQLDEEVDYRYYLPERACEPERAEPDSYECPEGTYWDDLYFRCECHGRGKWFKPSTEVGNDGGTCEFAMNLECGIGWD
jgi:hypothetical protein